MRASFLAAALAATALLAPETARMLLAGAASVLLESLPYLAGGVVAARALRLHPSLVAYAGCGCGAGPPARSVPAALATAALFGWPIALARLAIASAIARMRSEHAHDERERSIASDLLALAPAAAVSAAIGLALPLLHVRHLPPVAAFAAGALAGSLASPCAFGGIAMAGTLHTQSAAAAFGVLATAGLVALVPRNHAHAERDDACAYAILAWLCALVALQHGATLVTPHLTAALWACACFCAYESVRLRRARCTRLRVLAGLLAAAVVIGAPAPVATATATTLADAYPGEPIRFTGVAAATGTRSALVRYAILCCRADAAPVTLAVDRDLHDVRGRWFTARGILAERDGSLVLRVSTIEAVAPPSDPFVYR